MANEFTKHFDYGSLLPVLLFICGIVTLYLFSVGKYSFGNIMLMVSFLVYVINNIMINLHGFSTVFNEYLEDMAAYVAFSLTTVAFGFLYFSGDLVVFLVVLFYATSQLLSLSRNWILRVKNSQGWPVALNGIFFPFCFYLVVVFIQGFASGVFLIFYIVVGVLSISDKNFLGYTESSPDDFDIVDDRDFQRKRKKGLLRL